MKTKTLPITPVEIVTLKKTIAARKSSLDTNKKGGVSVKEMKKNVARALTKLNQEKSSTN
jgi:hypothetical protein